MIRTRQPCISAAERAAARQKILATVQQIPKGQVCSYSYVALIAGFPGRARLVAKILSDLPLAHQIPWQRVITASGRIAFPGDQPAHAIQRALLESEGQVFVGGKLRMADVGWRPMDERPLLD